MMQRMLPPPQHQMRIIRSNVLGGTPFDSLQSSDERDVYECLDMLVERVSITLILYRQN